MGSTDVVETVRYKLNMPELPKQTLSNIKWMQEMTFEICDTAAVGDEGIAIDLRDWETYRIAKLADEKCWMTQNLRLKLNASTLPLRGTSADGKTSDLPDGTEWNPGSSWYTVNGASYSTDNAGMASSNNGNGHGTYYMWGAATAGQGNSVTGSGSTDQSVCPKGWKLPSTGEFGTLYNAYGGNSTTAIATSTVAKLMAAPANFVKSGSAWNGGISGVGSEGNYWSSIASSSGDAYELRFSSSSISLYYGRSRSAGLTVRCVAR